MSGHGEGKDPWWGPLLRAVNAAIAFLGHLLISLVLIGCIWVLEHAFTYLWGSSQPLLYGRVPLKYLFDTLDVAVMAVFIVWGAIEAHTKLKG